MRTTRTHVENLFKRFVTAIGGREATSSTDVGGYLLDYAAPYGGYGVRRIVNAQGAQSDVFGPERRKASEMWDTLRFALDAIEERERNTAPKPTAPAPEPKCFAACYRHATKGTVHGEGCPRDAWLNE